MKSDVSATVTLSRTRQRDARLLTSSMFTEEDVAAITPLQIATYLTIKQREKMGTKVLCSQLKKGVGLVLDETEVCATCSLPKLRSREGRMAEKCPVCPVLKKRVLKKIMRGCS